MCEYCVSREIQHQFNTWGQDSISFHGNCSPASKPRRAAFLFPEVVKIITSTTLSGDLKATYHHCITLELIISGQSLQSTLSPLSIFLPCLYYMVVYMSPPPCKSINSEILSYSTLHLLVTHPHPQCFTHCRYSATIC